MTIMTHRPSSLLLMLLVVLLAAPSLAFSPRTTIGSTFLASSKTNLCASSTDADAATTDSSSSQQQQQSNNDQINQLLARARELGTVGMDRTEDERAELKELAQSIAALSDPQPARQLLTGLYNLVYSAAPGGSNGKIGPFTGKVTQEFVDDQYFINAVQLGPLQISLLAEREIKNDTNIKVTFLKTTVTLFGKTVTEKELNGTSGGVWKYLYYGTVLDDDSGKKLLVRVMETPSLFVLEQPLE